MWFGLIFVQFCFWYVRDSAIAESKRDRRLAIPSMCYCCVTAIRPGKMRSRRAARRPPGDLRPTGNRDVAISYKTGGPLPIRSSSGPLPAGSRRPELAASPRRKQKTPFKLTVRIVKVGYLQRLSRLGGRMLFLR